MPSMISSSCWLSHDKRGFTLMAIKVIASILIAILVAGCGRGEEYWSDGEVDTHVYFDETLAEGNLVFTDSVMAKENIRFIIPMGNLNPPGHSLPTDHIYLVTNGYRVDVFAPAPGRILEIEKGSVGSDDAVKIAVTKTTTFYLAHIYLDSNLAVGDEVQAGDRLGTSGGAPAIDLGVMNKAVSNGFLNRNYPASSLYGDAPLRYYESSLLRDELYALVKPPDDAEYPSYPFGARDGKFVFDKAGTLIGNWFRDGTLAYLWEEQLSFSYDCFYPDQMRIAIGRENATSCMLFAVSATSPIPEKPEDVTVNGEPVAYQLYNGNVTSKGSPAGSRLGLMMVEMLADDRIRIEISGDKTSVSLPFTEAAWYYGR